MAHAREDLGIVMDQNPQAPVGAAGGVPLRMNSRQLASSHRVWQHKSNLLSWEHPRE